MNSVSRKFLLYIVLGMFHYMYVYWAVYTTLGSHAAFMQFLLFLPTLSSIQVHETKLILAGSKQKQNLILCSVVIKVINVDVKRNIWHSWRHLNTDYYLTHHFTLRCLLVYMNIAKTRCRKIHCVFSQYKPWNTKVTTLEYNKDLQPLLICALLFLTLK